MAKRSLPAPDAEPVVLTYEGGLASSGQLHFYEYSRAAYGFARFINAVEHFRRTGRVIQKIGSKNYVEAIVRTPQHGSFITEVLVLAQAAAPYFTQIPIDVLVAYIANKLTVWTSKDTRDTKGFLEAVAKIERSRSKQETRRVEAIERMNQEGHLTTRLALELLRDALNEDRGVRRASGLTTERLLELERKMSGEVERNELIEKHEDELAKIGDKKLAKLSSRTRPHLQEIGLPLKRSASSVAVGRSPKQRVIDYTRDDIGALEDRKADEHEIEENVRIFAFNKDYGAGRLDMLDENILNVHFQLPVKKRRALREKVLESMNEDSVLAIVLCVRDLTDQITSVTVLDIPD